MFMVKFENEFKTTGRLRNAPLNKEELTNAKNLLRIRLKTQVKPFIWLFIVFALFLLNSLIGTITSIVSNENTIIYNIVSDSSVLWLVAIGVGFVIGNIMYRSTNAKLSVFPQTNNSRFISWLLSNYFLVTAIALALLVTYLVNYGVIMLMSVFIDGIYLVLNVDFGFIVAGFFTYLAYSFLIVAIIEFIGTVIRKWLYYAIVTFVALFSLMIVYLEKTIEYIPRMLSFLIAEPSILMFFLKAVGLWLILTGAALVLNRFTVYHRSQNWMLRKRITVACIIIAVVITIITPMIFRFSITIMDNSNNAEMWYVDDDDGNWDSDPGSSYYHSFRMEEIRIDVSHLPAGAKINIAGENIDVPKSGDVLIYSSSEMKAYISGAESLENVQGNTLVIQYYIPWYFVNGLEILHYGNPQITTYLEGDTLYINYTFDKATVIVLPVWGMVQQFDIFKDKGVLTGNALGMSAGGSMSVNIFIEVE